MKQSTALSLAALTLAMAGVDRGVAAPARSEPKIVTPDDMQTVQRVKAMYPHLAGTAPEQAGPSKPQAREWFSKRGNVRNKFGRVEKVMIGAF